MEFITDFLVRIFGNRLSVVITSALPLIELKGSIVLGRGLSLGFLETLALAFIGSFAVFFVLYFLYKPLLKLLKKIKGINKLCVAIESYFSARANKVLCSTVDSNNRVTVLSKFTVLLIFVAFPSPMTGVWTGTLIAVTFNLGFWRSLLAIGIGNLIAGLIISILAELFLAHLNIIFAVILLLAIIMVVVFIVKVVSVAKNIKE